MTGNFSLDALDAGNTSLTVKNMNIVGTTSATYGVISQNQTSTADDSTAEITLENCQVSSFSSKGIYLTNVKSLDLKNCTFSNCAGTPMNEPNTKGDYVIDLNLVGVQDASVNIEGCTFADNGAKKAIIKVSQRGGPSDADATDIPKDVGIASVSQMTVTGCAFTGVEEGANCINIGTTSKTAGNPVNISGSFPVTVSGNTTDTTISFPAYNGSVTVDAGSTFTNIAEVNTSEEFVAAANDPTINEISIKSAFDITEQISINHPIKVNGNNYQLTSALQGSIIVFLVAGELNNFNLSITSDNSAWTSTYGVQFYTGEYKVADCAITGGNAAILVNGSTVDLLNSLNVSGNTFGGIEVSKGTADNLTAGILNINGASIANTTEVYKKPTIWIDGNTDAEGIVNGAEAFTMVEVPHGDITQKQYYLDPANSVPAE